jgi:hypothetical protein
MISINFNQFLFVFDKSIKFNQFFFVYDKSIIKFQSSSSSFTINQSSSSIKLFFIFLHLARFALLHYPLSQIPGLESGLGLFQVLEQVLSKGNLQVQRCYFLLHLSCFLTACLPTCLSTCILLLDSFHQVIIFPCQSLVVVFEQCCLLL